MESSVRLLGLPLLSIAIGRIEKNGSFRRGVARGWIAIGDIAFGVVAIGGVAVGGISVGGVSVGAFSIGGLAGGLLALGGLALGIEAAGGAAIAWQAAVGGLAVAREYAVGGAAFARHANDVVAQGFITRDLLLRAGDWLMRHSRWVVLLALLPAVITLLKRISSGNEERTA